VIFDGAVVSWWIRTGAAAVMAPIGHGSRLTRRRALDGMMSRAFPFHRFQRMVVLAWHHPDGALVRAAVGRE
jgi:hypothetical protein